MSDIPKGVRMASRWSAKCNECGRPFGIGDMIVKMSILQGDWAHVACWPIDSPTTSR